MKSGGVMELMRERERDCEVSGDWGVEMLNLGDGLMVWTFVFSFEAIVVRMWECEMSVKNLKKNVKRLVIWSFQKLFMVYFLKFWLVSQKKKWGYTHFAFAVFD